MFKFVLLSCVASVAFAGLAPVHHVSHVKTIVEPHVSIVETPTVAHVGTVVKSIPTAHSYQSQTQYHSKSYVEPIYAHGVEKKIISTPVVKTVAVPVVQKVIAAPVVHHAPIVHHAPVVHHAPIVQKVVAAPAVHYSAPLVQKVIAAPAVHYSAPLSHYHHY